MEEVRLLSKVKDLTHKVVEKGEEHRRTFRPKASGKPLERYDWYYEQNSNLDEADKENFCRYFRIAFVYAPLLKLGIKLGWLFTQHLTWAVIFAGYIFGMYVVGQNFPPSRLLFFLIPFAIAGLVMGIYLGFLIRGEDPELKVQKVHYWWAWPFITIALLFAPIGMIVHGVILAIHTLITTVFTSEPLERFGTWMRYGRLVKGYVSPRSALFYLIYLGVAVTFMLTGLWIGAIVMGLLVVAVLAVIGLLGWLSVVVVMRRQRREDESAALHANAEGLAIAKLEPMFRRLYAHYYRVAPSANSADFDKWLLHYKQWRIRFIAYIDRVYVHPKPEYAYSWQLIANKGNCLFILRDHCYLELDIAMEVAGISGNVETDEAATQPVKVRKHRIRKFFTGVVEYIILLAQFIYAWKKQICPYIEFPDRAE